LFHGVQEKVKASDKIRDELYNIKNGNYNNRQQSNDHDSNLSIFDHTISNNAIKSSLRSNILFNFANIQTKSKVGQLDDIYEQEADQIAKQIACDPEKRHAINGRDKSKVLMASRGSGSYSDLGEGIQQAIEDMITGHASMLDQSTLSFMESKFGFDFSHVRIHTDVKSAKLARILGARAFTVGQDIVFDPEHFSTGSHKGRELIAHELVHVLQQGHVDSNTNAVVKQTESPGIIQRYVSPLDWVDYLSLGYDIGENVYLTFFYKGSDKEFQRFLNLFFTAIDLIMAATPGAGGGGVVARASHSSLALAWDALPRSAKAKVVEQVSKGMEWELAKTAQAINMLMRGEGHGGGESTQPKSTEAGGGPRRLPTVSGGKVPPEAIARERPAAKAEFGRTWRKALVEPPNFVRKITDYGVEHSFDEHASIWFGRNVTKKTHLPIWRKYIEIAQRSGKVFPSSLRGRDVVGHLSRIEGKWFAAYFDLETGELATAFMPRGEQLSTILRLIQGVK
jgi:Domain of unknown function (DUF4157)